MGRPRRWSWVIVVAVTVLTAACSGGGSDNRDLTSGAKGARDTQVQFMGADKVKLSGTFSAPLSRPKGAVAGVLLVPGVARTDRDGVTDLRRPDPLYRDLSQAFLEAGMATFRYDRRGVGLSKLEVDQQRLSYDDLVSDATAALTFLAQRKETENAPLAVVGYDTGGLIALSLAAAEPRVKGVALVSAPSRPVVDVYAEAFARTHKQVSADAFRQEVDTLMTTGSLPPRDQIRPEHEPVLPDRQDELLKQLFQLDPLALAGRVTAPTLVVTGTKSTLANATDAERFSRTLKAAELMAVDTNATLQVEGPDIPPPAFNPADESTHVFGASPYNTVARDQGAVDRMVRFFSTSLGGGKKP